MAKTVAILGTGGVGTTLAGGFLKHGYSVVIGAREAGKALKTNDAAVAALPVMTFANAARMADFCVLAVKGTVARGLVQSIAKELAGKIVMDTTNPIADTAPVNGVLSFFTSMNESLMEQLQQDAPAARFVKAFSCVGAGLMVNPDFGGQRPTMFICGNDEAAKKEVASVLDQFGHEVEDMGKAEGARGIEPLCILWCTPGFLRNQWTHALKLLKK
jgi:predicted dinucleotide-binding enzyme